MTVQSFLKPSIFAAAILMGGIVVVGPANSAGKTKAGGETVQANVAPTASARVVRDHRGQRPPSRQTYTTGWGNGGGTVRDHRQPQQQPQPCIPIPLQLPGVTQC